MYEKNISEKWRVYGLMQEENPGSERYLSLFNVYLRLCEAEAKKPRVSPDAILTAATNLAGILMILKHEAAHVIASKALNFVIRGRM